MSAMLRAGTPSTPHYGLVNLFMTVIDSPQINESYKDEVYHAAMACSAA